MASTYYQSVRIKPQTIRSEVYFTGDIAYTGVQQLSAIQQIYNTKNPFLLKYLSEEDRLTTNLEDARKVELSYLITNALKMWLQSKVGDYGRPHPGMGGPIDEYIGKVVSQERADSMLESLTAKIEQTFSSLLTINTLIVTPSPETKSYKIQLTVDYILVNKTFTINQELLV